VRSALEIRVESYDDPVVSELIAELQDEYIALYGGPDETEVVPDEFEPPGGGFLVGYLGAQPIGCGGFRRFDEKSAEIKRMFVRPTWRRRGFARALLRELERAIRSAGYPVVRLMTGGRQPDAIQLYLSEGYQVTARRYGVYEGEANAHFFVKALVPTLLSDS
jgi:GNAT superfamily N-acetyltransferase